MKTDKDIVKGHIINDYVRYIQHLEKNNWIRESVTIYELLSRIVTINTLKVNSEGTVLDIICPPGIIISISGIKSFPEDYNIENIPPFELKLSNLIGEEINPDTKIKLLRNKILRKPEEICEISYKDISMTNYSESSNKFKNYSELYRFDHGIELKGEDHLKIYVINPNIDIDIAKFNIGIDLWTQID